MALKRKPSLTARVTLPEMYRRTADAKKAITGAFKNVHDAYDKHSKEQDSRLVKIGKRSRTADQTDSRPPKKQRTTPAASAVAANNSEEEATSRQPFRLLALPPELCNLIYHFGTDMTDTTPFTMIYDPTSPTSWAERHRRRPYFGLTQVSKQLRKEFYPLHQKLRQPRVLVSNLGDYLETFPLTDRALSSRIATTSR